MDSKSTTVYPLFSITKITMCYFEDGYLDTNVYLWEELPCDHNIPDPAIIIDKNSTILVERSCVAHLTEGVDVCIAVGTDTHCLLGTELNTVQLSIFSHRFMSIAGMAWVLHRTSISMFGPDGGLVSNAPHIPVHLGAMQETVQYQHSWLQLNTKTALRLAISMTICQTLAANQRESTLVGELIDGYGLAVVQVYMGYIQVEAEDFMDDGTPIRLQVQMNENEVHPSQNAAVVGGNVLTSQRVVDVIFRAYKVCAASQVPYGSGALLPAARLGGCRGVPICFACIPLVEVDMVREDKQAAGYGRPLKNENFSERGSVFEYRSRH
ncbi:unnamed protein product [Coregonus sp. 'balchen']|nr:unnamed protein product [Coregonus sp. 'balchen']